MFSMNKAVCSSCVLLVYQAHCTDKMRLQPGGNMMLTFATPCIADQILW